MNIRTADWIHPLENDLDQDATYSAPDTDKVVNQCINAVTESLKTRSDRFNDFQRAQLSVIFSSMRHGHRAVREMLRTDGKDPMAVNVMPLARSQLETLFAICLLVEDPAALSLYLKDGWKKVYISHILMREECRKLPRIMDGLTKITIDVERFRVASGVSINEKLTIDVEELGITPPPDFVREDIRRFPGPHAVIRRVCDPERKRMLQRLYPEYQRLCGFVHFSPASRILSTLLDERQFASRSSTSAQKYDVFQKEIAGPAMWISLISTVQSCSEFVCIYPTDMELVKTTSEAWKFLAETSLLGQAIWNLRARTLFGALR